MVWSYNFEGAHHGWAGFGWGRVHGGSRRVSLFRRVRGQPWCSLTILKAHNMAEWDLGGAAYATEGCGYPLPLLCTRPAMVWSYNFEGGIPWLVGFGWGRIHDERMWADPLSIVYAAGHVERK